MSQPSDAPAVHVALGSNLGDRLAQLEQAVVALEAQPNIQHIRGSGLYDTSPVGGQATGRFLNAVIALHTTLAPLDLLAALQEIEASLGRARLVRWGDRTIDLDLVLWGDRVIQEPTLTVPHPEMHLRRFVLLPLADLAPDALHPVHAKTIQELLDALPADPADACTRLSPTEAGARWPGWQ